MLFDGDACWRGVMWQAAAGLLFFSCCSVLAVFFELMEGWLEASMTTTYCQLLRVLTHP